jgi:hypothetical protein
VLYSEELESVLRIFVIEDEKKVALPPIELTPSSRTIKISAEGDCLLEDPVKRTS